MIRAIREWLLLDSIKTQDYDYLGRVSSIHQVTSNFNGDLTSIVNEVKRNLDLCGFARVQNLFSEDEILESRIRVTAKFNAANDRKHDPRDSHLLESNFQKLVVGGTNGPNSTARFLRMFYTPFMDADIFRMHEIFRRLAIFRNELYGISQDFATKGIEAGYWSANRVHHYPRGGGFMAVHADVGTASVAREMGLTDYVQVILIMSQKGRDFHSGGAYVLDEHGERNFYEDECRVGDVVIYDGRIPHGVEEIDYRSPLDMNSPEGRFVAMTTLFKRFTSNSETEYQALLN